MITNEIVAKNRLTPLLLRIKENPKTVVMPVIDVISGKTLAYEPTSKLSFFSVGGFSWSGDFIWMDVQNSEIRSRTSPISPVKSPTMAGGLFAINRKYFWEIGSYDEKMDGWGGENLEMSFRVSN